MIEHGIRIRQIDHIRGTSSVVRVGGMPGPRGLPGADGDPGPQGPRGTGGAWLVGEVYAAGDVVSEGSAVYVALAATTGEQPSTHPAAWSVIDVTLPDVGTAGTSSGVVTSITTDAQGRVTAHEAIALGATGGVASYDDGRFADERTPLDNSVTNAKIPAGAAIALSKLASMPALASRAISAGTGLSGGGDLSADRTLSVVYGTAANTSCQGNDSRLSDTRTPTDGSVTAAKIVDGAVITAKLADAGAGAGTYGGSDKYVQSVTVDAKGRVTAAVEATALPSVIVVDLVAESNLTISGEQTIDGVTTSASRVLVTAQSTASQNGVWVTAAGSWTRATDYDAATEVLRGRAIFVASGQLRTNTYWTLTTSGIIAVGSTSLTYARLGRPSFALTYTVSLVGNGSTTDTTLVTLPFPVRLRAVVGTLTTAVTGAGTSVVTLGTTAGGATILAAWSITSATAQYTQWGPQFWSEMGSDASAAQGGEIYYTTAKTLSIRVANTGNVTAGSVTITILGFEGS